MQIDSKATGQIEVVANERRVVVFMPLEISVLESRPLSITNCLLEYFRLEDGTQLVGNPEVRIHYEPSDEAEIKNGVFVRAPKNLLHFRVEIGLPVEADERPDSESFTCRMTFEFNGDTAIKLRVEGTINWQFQHLQLTSVTRREKPVRLLVNLALLLATMGCLHFWTRYLSSEAYPQETWLLSPSHLDLITSFMLGFLGLQIVNLLLVARKLPGLMSIRDFPELHLAKPLAGVFLSRATTVVLPVIFLAAAAYTAWNWTVPLESGPLVGQAYFVSDRSLDGSSSPPAEGESRYEMLTMGAKIPLPKRVRLLDYQRLRLGCARSDGSLPVPVLGSLELRKPNRLGFAFWKWSLRPDYLDFAYAHADQPPAKESFSANEILTSQELPNWAVIQRSACGGDTPGYSVEFGLEGARRVVRVSPWRLFEEHHLQTLFGQAEGIERTRKLRELIEESQTNVAVLSGSFQTQLGSVGDRLLPLEALMERHRHLLLGNNQPGDPLSSGIYAVEVKRAVAEIQILRAYLDLIGVYGGETPSGADVEDLLEVARTAGRADPGIEALDKNVILSYLMFLLDLESRYREEAEPLVQASLERLLDRTGAEYYAVLLEAHARTGTLLSPLLSRATRQAREEFFYEKKAVIQTSAEACDRIEKLLRASEDPKEKQYLESLLG